MNRHLPGVIIRRVMKSAARLMASVVACLAGGSLLAGWHTRATASNNSSEGVAVHSAKPETKIANSWDPKAAATYLDGRIAWWMNWPRAQRDHETFCVPCHTALPYALSRSSLRTALAEQSPSPNEQRLLDNVTKRVRLWKQVEPFYKDEDRGPYKSVESRGTESVLNALILSSHDALTGHRSKDAHMAFENMWAEQQAAGKQKGAWLWLRFNNEPWEADDSDYFGATLAAIAIGMAPGDYRATPEVQTRITALRLYLDREFASQTSANRVFLLWAGAKLPGLVELDRQKTIIAELLEKQQADGGWSLASLSGDWKRHDGTPQETRSDGYATGLITFVLQQDGISSENPGVERGLAWLTANQDKTAGSWGAYSLNKSKEHHIAPETALFMNDAATSYAVLSLTAASSTCEESRRANGRLCETACGLCR
jgi:squalene-hopene/tetraprenyl-beta-curcumene cyclase